MAECSLWLMNNDNPIRVLCTQSHHVQRCCLFCWFILILGDGSLSRNTDERRTACKDGSLGNAPLGQKRKQKKICLRLLVLVVRKKAASSGSEAGFLVIWA